MRPVHLVLAKAPEPGRVKTRLCPPLDPAQAADLAAAALLDTLDAAGPDAVVAITGDLGAASRGSELRASLRGRTVLRQRGDGLGARIAAAHADAATARPGRAMLLIGMDTPQVGGRLAAAAGVLAEPGVDAVLGPASDGGYWTLGLRRPSDATVIAQVPTSRADTGAATLAALRGAGLTVRLLAELSDVDTVTDAITVAAQAPAGRFAEAVRALPALVPRVARS